MCCVDKTIYFEPYLPLTKTLFRGTMSSVRLTISTGQNLHKRRYMRNTVRLSLPIILVILVLTSCTQTTSLTITREMIVTNYEDSPEFYSISKEARKYLLKPGDKIIVSRSPSRYRHTRKNGNEVSHILGWLRDGTRIDIPLDKLELEDKWNSYQPKNSYQ
jgi:hypothetical protein